MQNRYESYTVAPERRSNEITKEWEKRLKGSKTYHCRRRKESKEIKPTYKRKYITQYREPKDYSKSIMMSIAEVITLISAVLNTIILVNSIIEYTGDLLSVGLYSMLLIFVWFGRYKSFKEEHRGWIIYSLIMGIMTINIFNIVGYICVLIHSFRSR